jgi:hypothetical protein
MIIFFDTSAWVKYFLNEEGTLRVQNFIIEYPFSEDNIFATSAVTYAEMIATMTRAYQGRRINDEELETMITMFQEQWRKVDVVEVNRELIELAGQMARTHALRGCDAFQLASALDTQTTLLISSDNDLNDAARNNGLNVWNPIEKDFPVKPID